MIKFLVLATIVIVVFVLVAMIKDILDFEKELDEGNK